MLEEHEIPAIRKPDDEAAELHGPAPFSPRPESDGCAAYGPSDSPIWPDMGVPYHRPGHRGRRANRRAMQIEMSVRPGLIDVSIVRLPAVA